MDSQLPHPLQSGPSAGRGSRWRTAGWVFVFLWFLLGGIAHFAATETEMLIVPPWIPWPRAAVLASGVFELLGAAGLLWPPTRRAAGWGLFLLTVAVTPCHLYMLQQPELFPAVPVWALWARLPIQVVLLALIVWSTAPAGAARAAALPNGMEVADNRRAHRSADRTP
jgi:uncharacterized membrane protein